MFPSYLLQFLRGLLLLAETWKGTFTKSCSVFRQLHSDDSLPTILSLQSLAAQALMVFSRFSTNFSLYPWFHNVWLQMTNKLQKQMQQVYINPTRWKWGSSFPLAAALLCSFCNAEGWILSRDRITSLQMHRSPIQASICLWCSQALSKLFQLTGKKHPAKIS